MYNKIFTKILDSSVWLEPTPTRIVWFTFLAAMDETGFVQFASAANVAHRARVDLAEADAALTCLESPDPHSSDPEFEGRRVERVPGGWMILNAAKYRDLVTRTVVRAQTRQRVQNYRERLKSQNLLEKPRTTRPKHSKRDTPLHERNGALNVTRVTSSDTDTDTDTEIVSSKNKLTRKVLPLSNTDHASETRTNGNGHEEPEAAAVFLAWFHQQYKTDRHGADYLVHKKRDEPVVRYLLKHFPAERLQKLAEIMLSEKTDDSFIMESDRGISILKIKANWLNDRLSAWEHRNGVN